jgi:hypothetical protein
MKGLTGEMLSAKELDLSSSTLTGPVRLIGAKITGQLNCSGTTLNGTDGERNALVADLLKADGGVLLRKGFTAAGAVRLYGADITGTLSFSGAALTGTDNDGNALVADYAKAGADVLLDNGDGSLDKGFTAAGAVRLYGADITGTLSFSGAALTGTDSDGYALIASKIKAGANVSLDEGFAATGTVRLVGANITGQFICNGATLHGRDQFGSALWADGMKAGADVFLDEVHTTAGAVRLSGADITGTLYCRRATLTGRDNDGSTLVADYMKASGGVHLDAVTAAGAVRLYGADITGTLSFSGAALTGTDSDGYALIASKIKAGANVSLDEGFAATGTVRLVGANITGQFICNGATLHGRDHFGSALWADGMKAGTDVFLDEVHTTAGAVRLSGADITGTLYCRRATLTGTDNDGSTLVADYMKASGGVHLDAVTAAGAVRLVGAEITKQLSCRGATLAASGHRSALVADGLKAGGDVLLDKGFTASGAVELPDAQIGGKLSCRGSRLTGADQGGVVLNGKGIKVGGDVSLGKGFTAVRTVSLAAARVTGSVDLRPARLAGEGQTALNMARAQIAGRLRWAPRKQVSGRVNLEGCSVGELEDAWSGKRANANGYWPGGGLLSLDGFIYGRFSEDQKADVEQRLSWVRSQYQRSGDDGPAKFAAHPKELLLWIRSQFQRRAGDSPAGFVDFATQPYEQLAAVYRKAGQDDQARTVAIARRADLRKFGNLNRSRWLGNWFLDWSIKYGYETWRAILYLTALFVAFLLLSIVGQHLHVIVPVGDIKGLYPVPTATQCTNDYPCFYPVGYTVDTVVPIINVHQADHWGPDGHAPWGWFWVSGTWMATVAGWALATLLVAGYTGLVRRD